MITHNALKTLSYITAGLNLSVKAQVNNAYSQLTEKARLILKGFGSKNDFLDG